MSQRYRSRSPVLVFLASTTQCSGGISESSINSHIQAVEDDVPRLDSFVENSPGFQQLRCMCAYSLEVSATQSHRRQLWTSHPPVRDPAVGTTQLCSKFTSNSPVFEN